MAEQQGKIRITASAELGELQKLNGAIEKMGDGFLKSVSAASLMNKGLETALGLLKEGYEDLSKYSKATTVFTGNLESLRQATKGLASDLDLMQAHNKLVTLGVKLSSEQMKELYSNVARVAPAMGIDLTQALDNAATALARQSVPVADNLGVVMKLSEAQKKYADSIGKTVEQLTPLENRLAFQSDFMDGLATAARRTAEQTATLTGYMAKFWVTTKNGILEALNAVNKLPGNMSSWLFGDKRQQTGFTEGRDLYAVDFLDTSVGGGSRGGAAGVGERVMDLQTQGYIERGMESSARVNKLAGRYGKKSKGGGSRKKAWWETYRAPDEKLESELEFERDQMAEREGVEMEAGFARIDAEKAAKDEEAARKRKADAMAFEQQNLMRLVDQTKRYNAELEALASGGLKSVYGGLLDLADAAISGQDGIGKMALNMLKAVTLGLSQQLFAMGLAASIEAAGYAAGVVTAPLAAAASAKAGIFYAGAAALAGLGLGFSAASAAVGGKGAGGASAGASAGANFRPSFGQSQSSKDLPPIVIRLTFDRNDPASEQFARRKVRADMVAAGYSEAA